GAVEVLAFVHDNDIAFVLHDRGVDSAFRSGTRDRRSPERFTGARIQRHQIRIAARGNEDTLALMEGEPGMREGVILRPAARCTRPDEDPRDIVARVTATDRSARSH